MRRTALVTLAACLTPLLSGGVALAQFGPSAVVVAPVERRPVEVSQPLVASVEPVTRSTLAAEQAGLVAERAFDEGQVIERGQVLTKLKTDLLAVQLASAEAARASSEAAVAQAEAQLENADVRLGRMQKLTASNAITGDELRDALTEQKVRQAAVRVAVATLAERAAEVDRLKLQIEKSSVKAPIVGVVSKRHVEVGQWLELGDPVADVVQLDPLFVRVNVPESLLASVRPGDPARLTIDALGGDAFTGKVDQVLPEGDPASRTFPVKLLVPNPGGRIRPGFFARVTLLSRTEATLVVPKDAVVQRGTDASVMVARDGKAVPVPVKRGTADGRTVAVTPLPGQTLTADDKVIVRGNEGLRGGEQLMVLPGPGGPPGGGGGGGGGAPGRAPPSAAPATTPATQPATAPAAPTAGANG